MTTASSTLTERKGSETTEKMAPQVGFEPHPEIPTAETIVLKIVKNTRKTSVDAGFEGVFDLSLKAGKTCQVGGRQYKSSTFLGHENRVPSSQPIPVCARRSFVVPPKEASKVDGSALVSANKSLCDARTSADVVDDSGEKGRSVYRRPAAAFLVLLPRAAQTRIVPTDLGSVAPGFRRR